MNLNPAMLPGFPRVKQAGFRTRHSVRIWEMECWDILRPRFPWLAQFDHLTWSCELGVVNPTPAIICTRSRTVGSLAGQGALFIDNLQKNVEGAEAYRAPGSAGLKM